MKTGVVAKPEPQPTVDITKYLSVPLQYPLNNVSSKVVLSGRRKIFGLEIRIATNLQSNAIG